MMKSVKTCALLFVWLYFSTPAYAAIKFTVEPRPQTMFVLVHATIVGLKNIPQFELKMAKEYGSVTNFSDDVRDLKIVGSGPVQIAQSTEIKNQWHVLNVLGNDTVTYEYKIVVHQNSPNEVIRFKPSLDPNSYYSNGFPIFIYPTIDEKPLEDSGEGYQVEFKNPTGWNNFTSLNLHDQNIWSADTADQLLTSTIALGNYRAANLRLPNGVPLQVLINGTWKFTDAAFADSVQKIIAAQIQLMGSWSFPIYTVVLSRSGERGASGSGLINAFEMFGDVNRTLADVQSIISHENFHYWNGQRIAYEAPKDRWFSEGFTDYYTYIALSRMNLWSLKETLLEVSKNMDHYYENPVAESITFKDAGQYFWDYLAEYGNLTYSKGTMIAFMMDVKLRASSLNRLSLDGFMRQLDQKYANTGVRINERVVLNELRRYSGMAWDDFINRFVLGKEQLPINDFINAGGMKVGGKPCPRTEMGAVFIPHFCGDKACGYTATQVIESGPAFKAGLRDGNTVTQWTPKYFQHTAPGSQVELIVAQSAQTSRSISFTVTQKVGTCHQLEFLENQSPLAEQIRQSIWFDDNVHSEAAKSGEAN